MFGEVDKDSYTPVVSVARCCGYISCGQLGQGSAAWGQRTDVED